MILDWELYTCWLKSQILGFWVIKGSMSFSVSVALPLSNPVIVFVCVRLSVQLSKPVTVFVCLQSVYVSLPQIQLLSLSPSVSLSLKSSYNLCLWSQLLCLSVSLKSSYYFCLSPSVCRSNPVTISVCQSLSPVTLSVCLQSVCRSLSSQGHVFVGESVSPIYFDYQWRSGSP